MNVLHGRASRADCCEKHTSTEASTHTLLHINPTRKRIEPKFLQSKTKPPRQAPLARAIFLSKSKYRRHLHRIFHLHLPGEKNRRTMLIPTNTMVTAPSVKRLSVNMKIRRNGISQSTIPRTRYSRMPLPNFATDTKCISSSKAELPL